ncbi:pilus assembly protein TadG-related protein [Streptomyces sp. NPDC047718]|uniref:pilus assembly protein TadG-related protein n=1 Tax=Streptomyces sp. NPDC047718 TaxID=3155479 RepID=UPI0033C58FF8
MTRKNGLGDGGQAFPIYIVVVAGLLFASLAFFVVGMAGATRSNAQGAADAAALAAAREARDNAFLGLDLLALEPADWEKIAGGDLIKSQGACAKAVEFAALNDATAECRAAVPEFAVSVRTKTAVGRSVIPASGDMHGEASARALIEPRCSLRSATPAPTPTVAASPSPTPSPTPSSGPGGVTFVCSGKVLKLDPAKPGPLRQLARALFTVRLVD